MYEVGNCDVTEGVKRGEGGGTRSGGFGEGLKGGRDRRGRQKLAVWFHDNTGKRRTVLACCLGAMMETIKCIFHAALAAVKTYIS